MTVPSVSRLELFHLSIPLVSPFRNAAGSLADRQIGLVKLTRGNSAGWGESSPYPGQDEALDGAIAHAMAGRPSVAIAAGTDQASHDLRARVANNPLVQAVGAFRSRVPISLAIGAGPGAEDAVTVAVDRGVKRFKVKVAPGRVDHVRAIRHRHPDLLLGIDANASFTSESVSELAELADIDIAYVEEPAEAPTEEVFARVREILDAPVFADESVRTLADIAAVASGGNVDGVVIKPARFGFTGALDAVALAEELGLRWRASGLLETSVGRSYTNMLACLPGAFVSDVAPADWFLEADVATTEIDDGEIVLRDSPGVGFDPDEEVIDRYLVERYDLTHLLDVEQGHT